MVTITLNVSMIFGLVMLLMCGSMMAHEICSVLIRKETIFVPEKKWTARIGVSAMALIGLCMTVISYIAYYF